MSATYGTDSTHGSVLYIAFELGWTTWRLALGVGFDCKPRIRSIAARDTAALEREIEGAKKRFGLAEDAPVVSCYEAGRDGFWLHRYLREAGIANLVVDSSSIDVKRRRRRVKCDRLDAAKLLTMLIRYEAGEEDAWSVVNAPGQADEDSRHLHRELLTLKKDRSRHTNRIKGWLAGCGLKVEVNRDLPRRLERLRLWDGSPVACDLQRRILRELARWEVVQQQIRQVETERARLIRSDDTRHVEQVRQLIKLRGIGVNSAWLYVMEFFGWRQIRNRRQLAALAGLAPTPHDSGETRREQGISKAGNRYIRAMAIEIAWGWLRFQPQSALSQW
ncbi:MAG: IS110 family RNA-guided transposase, partial [Planctomycetota bacterium]